MFYVELRKNSNQLRSCIKLYLQKENFVFLPEILKFMNFKYYPLRKILS